MEEQGKDERKNQNISRKIRNKRTALRSLLGAAVVAAGPEFWMRPVVNSVILPVHAQTTTAEIVPQTEQPPLQTPPLKAPENTPPLGENVVVDAQEKTEVNYSLLPHISDSESPASALSISIVSPPASGFLTLIGAVDFLYELSPQSFAESDQFEYQVADPQGLKSPVYTVDLINFPVVPQ